MGDDFDLVKELWIKINKVTVPQLSPDSPLKACFLMETPGFSINPSTYDTCEWNDKSKEKTESHPDRIVAELADKVPALSPFYYDTGSRISSYWNQLVTTFKLPSQVSDADSKKYKEAVEFLYGKEDELDCEKIQLSEMKPEIDQRVTELREKWKKAQEKKKEFWEESKVGDKDNWPKNFEMEARPYVDKINDAFTEYDNFRCLVENYQAVIFRYRRGDLGRLLLQQAQAMGQYRYHDPGEGGSAAPFYVTRFEPKDWWKWFKEDYNENHGWTQVSISHSERSTTEDSTYTKVSASVSASYGLSSAKVSHSTATGSKDTSVEAKDLTITFMVRKVKINRPWLETSMFNYKTIGISGLEAKSWSTGTLDSKENYGQFPLLPTAMVVAKDVCIDFGEMSFDSSMKTTEHSTSVGVSVNVGCFSFGGSMDVATGSSHSEEHSDASRNTLKVKGAHVIGWVCVAIPSFPAEVS